MFQIWILINFFIIVKEIALWRRIGMIVVTTNEKSPLAICTNYFNDGVLYIPFSYGSPPYFVIIFFPLTIYTPAGSSIVWISPAFIEKRLTLAPLVLNTWIN